MRAMQAIIVITMLICIYSMEHTKVDGIPAPSNAAPDFGTCEQQLSKYRKFLLQAVLNFEDVCDAYSAHPPPSDDYRLVPADPLFRHYQPVVQQRTEIWAFFKLLMAQFNDLEFTNIIRDAVIERCHIKSQLQRDEKRNPSGLVLGKKQRFHSWGGKRSQGLGSSVALDSMQDY